MNTKITLTNPTDDELSAAVARYVAGQYSTRQDWDRLMELHQTTIPMFLPYATGADAVLPLLEQWVKQNGFAVNITILCDGKGVDVFLVGDRSNATTLPRAVCIALLRANGVEVIT